MAFGGSLHQSSGLSEVWNCSVNLYTGIPAGEWLSDPQAWADAVSTPLATWFGASTTSMASSAFLEYVKVNNIDTLGHYADGVTHEHLYGTPISGAVAAVAPTFCSIAITWETGLQRGLASRGRIYPPNPTASSIGSQITTGAVDLFATAGKALLSLILDTLDGTTVVNPVVCSKGGIHSSVGVVRHITGVSVDNIYDTQRRRKNRDQAIRHTITFP